MQDDSMRSALHDCILYLAYACYLESKNFTGVCKSVHPWGHVSETVPKYMYR